MTLLDLLRPRWKHSDLAVRKLAIMRLRDDGTLLKVLRFCPGWAGWCFKRMKDDRRIAEIASSDCDLGLRLEAIKELAKRSDGRLPQDILSTFRAELVRSLDRCGAYGYGDAANALEDMGEWQPLLSNEDATLQYHAAAALVNSGDRQAFEKIVSFLDQDPGMYESAIRALGRLGDKRAIPQLIGIATAMRFGPAPKAADALYEIDDNWGRSDHATVAVPAIIEAYENAKWPGERYLVRMLGSIGDSRCVEYLINLAQAVPSKTREAALLDATGNDYLEVLSVQSIARAALSALGESGNCQAKQWLKGRALAGQQDPALLEALVALGDRETIDSVIRSFSARPSRQQALILGRLDDERSLMALLECVGSPRNLSEDDRLNTATAVYSLQVRGDARAVPVLLAWAMEAATKWPRNAFGSWAQRQRTDRRVLAGPALSAVESILESNAAEVPSACLEDLATLQPFFFVGSYGPGEHEFTVEFHRDVWDSSKIVGMAKAELERRYAASHP